MSIGLLVRAALGSLVDLARRAWRTIRPIAGKLIRPLAEAAISLFSRVRGRPRPADAPATTTASSPPSEPSTAASSTAPPSSASTAAPPSSALARPTVAATSPIRAERPAVVPSTGAAPAAPRSRLLRMVNARLGRLAAAPVSD